MAKVIQQDTFDTVIQENIVEFGMSVDEARKETIEQFVAQHVDLSNLILDLTINEATGKPVLSETIGKLKDHVEKKNVLAQEDLNKLLDCLLVELVKSVPHRVLAGKIQTQELLLKLIESEIDGEHAENSILHKLVLSAHAMTNKNPDIFDAHAMKVVMQLLDTQKNERILVDTMRWIQKACLLHEKNRQLIVNEDILVKHLKPLLERDEPLIVKNVCTCFRFFILDDDVRCEFGKAHDHARGIAQECLVELTQLQIKFKNSPEVLAELMLTIASLAVRNEFCQTVAEAGGLTSIMDSMVEFHEDIKIIRESFKLLKALAGNDTVKTDIIKSGAASIIESSFNRHKQDETVAKSALVCISTLALRVRENAMCLFDSGVPETIIETMKIHEKNQMVQRNAAWAIRNMVSRAREQCEAWLQLGAEDVLNAARVNHPSIEQDLKSALRDLGAKVHLVEEWKGTAEKPITSNE